MNNQKNTHVLIVVKKDILKKIIIDNQNNLVYYLYYIILDVKKRNLGSRKYSKKTKDVNLYNNKTRNRYI